MFSLRSFASAQLPQCSNYATINDPSRENTYTLFAGTTDASFFLPGAWYRFTDASGFNFVPVSSPGISPKYSYACGAHYAGWYSGSLPMLGNTATGEICYSDMYSGTGDTCAYSFPVTMSQCDGFALYMWEGAAAPSSRYARVCTTNVQPVAAPPLLPPAPYPPGGVCSAAYTIINDPTRAYNYYNSCQSLSDDTSAFQANVWYRFLDDNGKHLPPVQSASRTHQ